MEKHEKTLLTAILLSEASHIFCCVLPTIFSILSLMSSFGVMVAMPVWMQSVHDTMHAYEVPMIALSAFVVLLGWGLHYLAHHRHKIGPHEHDCCGHDHGAPGPRAKTTHKILIAASVLLVINITIYFVFHRHQADWAQAIEAYADHAHSSSLDEAER